MTTSRLRSPMSASTRATECPSCARAAPRLAVVVVLPTPPLPDVMTIALPMELLLKAGGEDAGQPTAVLLDDDGSVDDVGDLGGRPRDAAVVAACDAASDP